MVVKKGGKMANLRLNWVGTFSQGGGYSGASEAMAVALEKAGVDITVMRLSPYSQRNVRPEGKRILKKPFRMADVGIAFSYPTAFTSLMNHKVRIGYSMFETDKLPEQSDHNSNWVSDCNTLTRLWVPAQHSKDLFRKSGVVVPIDVIPQGVDPEIYSYYERPERDTFTFLMLGKLTIRKNPGMVLSAFLSLFRGNPNVRMVFKTQSGTMGHLTLPEKNIKIIDKLTSVEETIKCYRDADAFVFPSRGEGFGLPPVEAMATGLPTIVASNSGMLEYTNEEYNYPIKFKEKIPVMHMPKEWGDCGNWWESDYEDLKAKMKYVYEHRNEAKAKGKKSAEWVANNFTYKQTVEKMTKILKQYYD